MTSRDETGQLLLALGQMQHNLKERTERERATAAENARIKTAVDQASASVIVADEEHRIMTQTVQQNAALVEEASAASQAMAQQARLLDETISKYRTRDERTRGSGEPRYLRSTAA